LQPSSVLPFVGIALRLRYYPSSSRYCPLSIVLPFVGIAIGLRGIARRCSHRQYCLSSVFPIVFGIAYCLRYCHRGEGVSNLLVLPFVNSIAHRVKYIPSSVYTAHCLQYCPSLQPSSVFHFVGIAQRRQYCPSLQVLPIVNSIALRRYCPSRLRYCTLSISIAHRCKYFPSS
jgi:hypothetical protein